MIYSVSNRKGYVISVLQWAGQREMYLIRFELVFNLANFVFVVPVLLKEQWCVLLL